MAEVFVANQRTGNGTLRRVWARNSNYKQYNKVVEEVASTMVAWGASLLLSAGKADEGRSTTEEDFMAWKENLVLFLKTHLDWREHAASRSLITKESHEGVCIHMDINLSGQPEIKYKSGDHIASWPVNPRDEVDRLLQVLDIKKADQRIIIQSKAPETELRLPRRTNALALFEHYLDICAPVPRQVVLSLVDFTIPDVVKIALRKIGKDKATYSAFLASTRLTFARLLAYTSTLDPNINWLSLPLSFVIESIPTMSPRCYSISTSNITSPTQVSITISVKQTRLALKPEVAIFGLTSQYLASLGTSPCQDPGTVQKQNPLQTIQAQIRRSNFKLPMASTVPLVLVAADTGIAPLRAFIPDRARLAVMGRQIGNITLFFGRRDTNIDFLYRDELATVAVEPLEGKFELVTAYSRVPGKDKRYVQDAMWERMG
ncbi:uncharacterized protein A1O5_04901 [Cladophialophora psammophila CBS 110553]|uniref:FAD-binding FR-type domain-containing protein n=1 Tax=Cladophialophora psammophila CBS 110553 TaxID=1182543 RepID=W9WW32_9EURO|nr:uncharacterized protein A1O5_04901 [Cladophialophora psammophila CBS 110553]EXJ72397.1 hypothetical protein A1O5_04901 [Cladophialophora psammophila CBS 110553]